MAVYQAKRMEELKRALHGIASTFFMKTALTLSAEDFISAFIEPEHVPKLREFEEMVGFVTRATTRTALLTHRNGGEGDSAPGRVRIVATMEFTVRAPVIVPTYISHGLTRECPLPLEEKITAWADERLHAGIKFGAVQDALFDLNETCTSVEAMNAVLPCMATLLGGISSEADSKTAKRAQALAESNKVGTLPRLPRQVKEHLQEAAALVNAATLMRDAELPGCPKHSCTISESPYPGTHIDGASGAKWRPGHIMDRFGSFTNIRSGTVY